MEAILGFIGIAIVWFIAAIVIGFIRQTLVAGAKTAFGSGTFKENFTGQFERMGPLETKVEQVTEELGGRQVPVAHVYARGLFNVPRKLEAAFVVSIHDKTDGKFAPVLSSLDWQQEEESTGFQILREAGVLEPEYGLKKWVKIGTIIPEVLVPPYSGERKFEITLRLITAEDIGKISWGFHDKDMTIHSMAIANLTAKYSEPGWKEEQESREELKVLAVTVAIGMAAADGELAEQEARIIQRWMQRQVDAKDGRERDTLKNKLNDAFKQSYAASLSDQKILVAKATARIEEIGNRRDVIAIMELLMDVAGADGSIDKSEIAYINRLGVELDIDIEEIRSLTDKAFLDSDVAVGEKDSLEEMLGIDPTWPKEKIRTHLREQFRVWNGRVQALSDPAEREKAQKVIEAIGEARKKYSS
jgi:uncharacterized tellurite resistance protein B-like protein